MKNPQTKFGVIKNCLICPFDRRLLESCLANNFFKLIIDTKLTYMGT